MRVSKKLYGFNEKSHKKSEWDRLLPIMKYFPEVINRQYQDLTYLLEKQSHTFTWWKDERNFETHLDAEKLYKSRQEEIIESKVMMDSMKLYNTLMAVSNFLGNIHACLLNFLVGKYRRSELSEWNALQSFITYCQHIVLKRKQSTECLWIFKGRRLYFNHCVWSKSSDLLVL